MESILPIITFYDKKMKGKWLVRVFSHPAPQLGLSYETNVLMESHNWSGVQKNISLHVLSIPKLTNLHCNARILYLTLKHANFGITTYNSGCVNSI